MVLSFLFYFFYCICFTLCMHEKTIFLFLDTFTIYWNISRYLLILVWSISKIFLGFFLLNSCVDLSRYSRHLTRFLSRVWASLLAFHMCFMFCICCPHCVNSISFLCFSCWFMVPSFPCSLYVSFLSVFGQVFWLLWPLTIVVKRGRKLRFGLFLKGRTSC